ncbi:MAG: ribosome biogenesis GTP-binding protein YihA/YsxC [Bacteroidota bacterium]
MGHRVVSKEKKTATIFKSSQKMSELPAPDRPEYAFVGRSNVGKSSLINTLTNKKKLAKTSATPGKTQLMNHFLIDETWYLVDLPGYGYAKTSKHQRTGFQRMITRYVLERENLMNLFVLVDSRHGPQPIDLEFFEFLGMNGVPFSIIFTKIDKLKEEELADNLAAYKKEMLKAWEEMPPVFLTSSSDRRGKDEVMAYIHGIHPMFER